MIYRLRRKKTRLFFFHKSAHISLVFKIFLAKFWYLVPYKMVNQSPRVCLENNVPTILNRLANIGHILFPKAKKATGMTWGKYDPMDHP
jgi:hypothetical protein